MKRKYLFLAVTMLVVFLVTGCSSSEEKTMTCTRTMNQSGMKTNLNYKVTYSGDYVNRVQSEESIETSDTTTLNTYKEQIENVDTPYKDIEYYTYNVTIDGNKLISTVDINYAKIDTSK